MIYLICAVLAYEPTFESLDSRPIPPWFEDLKFGLFIHWGIYSVPGWSMTGSYQQWYQMWLNQHSTYGNVDRSKQEVWQHHQALYGKNFSYYNFASMFKPVDFRPDDWASLFQRAGVKYIVYTTKHHQGYTMFPSKFSSLVWGFNWTAPTTAPGQDLVEPLRKAIRKTDIKFGLYYSLLEWYNPVLKDNFSAYVNQYMTSHLKDIVTNYEPDILWSDGDWIANSNQWKSKEFLAWLYTNSSVKDKVVVNGRWGTDLDWKKGPFVGNYMALQFDGGDQNATRPWEQCRGIGISFGYNQNQGADDINSVQVLLLNLIDRVSSGGNMLLGIGPDSTGKIPAIMQDRLLSMGQWLKINGQAIYGTRRGKPSYQVSNNGSLLDAATYKQKHSLIYVPGDFILKQTVMPQTGYAVKQLYFTKKGSVSYIFVMKWVQKIRIRNSDLGSQKVTFLETGQSLNSSMEGSDSIIYLPKFDPESIKSRYLWVLKAQPKADRSE